MPLDSAQEIKHFYPKMYFEYVPRFKCESKKKHEEKIIVLKVNFG